jgi:sulfotransferase
MKNIFFFSGLPRTGSTLLTSILTENSNIYSEGNSALCQLMWDAKISCEYNAIEQLTASNKEYFKDEFISHIPDFYYKNINSSIIIDKCRSWTLPDNLQLIEKYITDTPKIIVLTRPILDIVRSFSYLYKINNTPNNLKKLLEPGSEPIMRSLFGVDNAKKNNNGKFLFISYNKLIKEPKSTIESIYKFLGVEKFNHNFDNILNRYPENEDAYEIKHMHDVRKTIEKRKINFKLPQEIVDMCKKIDEAYPYL